MTAARKAEKMDQLAAITAAVATARTLVPEPWLADIRTVTRRG